MINLFIGGCMNIQNAIENMIPHPLAEYTRKCYNNMCEGPITVTKSINNHIWIDTIMYKKGKEIECKLEIYHIIFGLLGISKSI